MMSNSYLQVKFLDIIANEATIVLENRLLPFANSAIYNSSLKDFTRLTRNERDIYRIVLTLRNNDIDFLPGDTIGILPQNDENVINQLINRLNFEKIANKQCEIEIAPQTTKKNPTIPKHLPQKSTVRNIFLNNIDIQSVPKKIFLKSLIPFTTDQTEASYLEKLCSINGKNDYMQFVSNEGKTLLGLLNNFSSCYPSIEILLEHVPPLLPRPYSISSSPLKNDLEITFIVVEKENGTKGLCTSWLKSVITQKSVPIIQFYLRQPTKFRLPKDITIPLILICAGTGIAPFRGFLQHRLLLQRQENNRNSSEIWLFYGCRDSAEFIYKTEIDDYLSQRILSKLEVAFSRDREESQCYVQDLINKNDKEFFSWVIEKQAHIFVCGDQKSMVKDVEDTIKNIFIRLGELSSNEAQVVLNDLMKNNRYVVDSWI